MMATHLIRCYDYAYEDEWNRYLFAPLDVVEHEAPDFSVVEDRAIFVVIGRRGLEHVPARFLERVKRLSMKGLYHLGDEFLSGGYELYRHFDFVIRNYYGSALRGEGIRTVPLGYPVGMAGDGTEPRASARRYAWCFLGNMSAARPSMIAELRRLAPYHLHTYHIGRDESRALSREEYKEILRASAFAPCPMGNVMLETWRLYEALEAGTIPLLSRRALMPYHDLIMPDHPIPTFTNWRSARRFAERSLADAAALDALQRRVTDWWRAYKADLQAEMAEFVTRGFAGAYRDSLRHWQPRSGWALRTWRLLELSRHHDIAAAAGRCKIMLGRLLKAPA